MRRIALVVTMAGILATRCGQVAPTTPIGPGLEACANPAPLHGVATRPHPERTVESMIVRLKEGYDVTVEAPRLGRKYGFTVREYFGSLPTAFLADLHVNTTSALRCEPSVLDLTFSETNIPPP